MLEECKSVVSQDIRRIGSSLVRLGAVAMPTQIGHHHPVTKCRNLGCVPVSHPIDVRR